MASFSRASLGSSFNAGSHVCCKIAHTFLCFLTASICLFASFVWIMSRGAGLLEDLRRSGKIESGLEDILVLVGCIVVVLLGDNGVLELGSLAAFRSCRRCRFAARRSCLDIFGSVDDYTGQNISIRAFGLLRFVL